MSAYPCILFYKDSPCLNVAVFLSCRMRLPCPCFIDCGDTSGELIFEVLELIDYEILELACISVFLSILVYDNQYLPNNY